MPVMPAEGYRTIFNLLPLLLIAGYGGLLLLLTIPAVQREAIFLHHIPMPLFAEYDKPQKYGLAPFKTRNLKLNTSDGETLGAWHVLPHSIYKAHKSFPPSQAISEDVFEQALRDRPTVIYFHGNAGNRATAHRVRGYSSFSNYLDCNVLAIDYRGFADSSGVPSEAGLIRDARAAFDWVTSFSGYGAKEAADQVVLVGQSLGTGVVAGLAGELAREGISARAIALIAPFTSITELLEDYKLFKIIPILGPLKRFPRLQRYFQSHLHHPFNSTAALTNVSSPGLFLSAEDDDIIPAMHASYLCHWVMRDEDALPGTSTQLELYHEEVPGWGWLVRWEFGGKETILWRGVYGGHNDLGWAEGTLELIKRVARL
ncbi:hypothetical protein IAT38_008321 [Cryptococcus sp. DSM 104549]